MENPSLKREDQRGSAFPGDRLNFPRGRRDLFAPIDISSLVFFRIFFGLIMLYEVYRYFKYDWIRRYWIEPYFHFTYWPFDFLTPLEGDGMYYLFYGLGLSAIFITLGLFYRLSALFFFLGFTYSFLLEEARYLNHFYLVSLISFLMILVPANRSFSIDRYIFPRIHAETAPSWSIWILRFTTGVPYFCGGIAKITPDWLRGEPLRTWLSDDTDLFLIGPLLSKEWFIYFLSYGGLIFDLAIVPLLLWRRTRPLAVLAVIVFHLMNSQLFQIGIFPWFMIGAVTLFCEPGWFRAAANTFIKWPLVVSSHSKRKNNSSLPASDRALAAFLVCWCAFHILFPLRHFLYPGKVHWTEEGHKYAWHMKLRTKRGWGSYSFVDKKTGYRERVFPENFLTPWQIQKMEGRPEMIWKFSQIVRSEYLKRGMDLAVYADVRASLNGRDYQQLIDPTVDLAAEPRPIFSAAPWIVPLEQDLR